MWKKIIRVDYDSFGLFAEGRSTMRKTPRVGFVLVALVAALVAPGFACSVAAQENPYTNAVDELMGQRTFRAQCGRCHGRDARGGQETGAPDLTVPLDANTDPELFAVIREGIPGTAMTGINRRASDQMVWQIVTYLNSFSVDPSDYELSGDVTRGQRVYADRECARCHRLQGEGGRFGPDLTTLGTRLDPGKIRSSLTDPDETVVPRWWTVRVTRADGSVVEGLRMDEDTFTVRLLDTNEDLWHFVKNQVQSVEPVKTSTMPAVSDLAAGQLDDLVAYLFSLRPES